MTSDSVMMSSFTCTHRLHKSTVPYQVTPTVNDALGLRYTTEYVAAPWAEISTSSSSLHARKRNLIQCHRLGVHRRRGCSSSVILASLLDTMDTGSPSVIIGLLYIGLDNNVTPTVGPI